MIDAVIIAWVWAQTLLGTSLWINYRHYVRACRVAEAALVDYRIADAKARATRMDVVLAAHAAEMKAATERLRQATEELSTRQTKQHPTEGKTA